MASPHPPFYPTAIIVLLISICSHSAAQAQEAIEFDNGQVISLHFIALKPGVDTVEFEQWVREEFNPSYYNLVPGFSFYIAKIDRGTPDRLGKYAKVIIHKSKASRNVLWPEEGKPDKETTATIYEVWDRLYPKYTKYIEDTGSADYIEMRRER